MHTHSAAAIRRAVCRLFALLLLLSAAPAAFAQDAAAPVRASLSLSGEKKVFRAGEPIRLRMSFTSEREGYQLDTTTTKPPHAIDKVTLSPDAGAYAWAADYTGGGMNHPDYAAFQNLSATPTTIELTLNDWYRFDRPGKYTVKISTARVAGTGTGPGPHIGDGPRLNLTTNEVSFEVVEMSEAEEAEEVKRLSALLDAAQGRQAQAQLTEELSYLAGEPSTREKVRRFVGVGSGNSAGASDLGLFIARDRALAVRLLEAALRDPSVPATHALLGVTTSLRLMLEGVPRPPMSFILTPQGDSRTAEVQREYALELLASLPKRKGKSRTSAAMAVLTSLPRDGSAGMPTALRDVFVGEFETFHPYDQHYLLDYYWEQLRDPVLLPVVERMYLSNPGPQGYQMRTTALRRIKELNPEKARAYIIAEIRDPSSGVDEELLASLPDQTLPEVDDALLEQIKSAAPQSRRYDFLALRQKALLAARYGSPAIYDGLLEAYRAWGDKWQPDARGALLGYLARYNPQQAVPLVEQALAQVGQGNDSTLLLEVARASYPAELRELLRRRLEGEDPSAVGSAAYVMSQRGVESDAPLLEARLERWRKDWAGHAAELDAPEGVLQRMAEVNLVSSLLMSKVWKLPKEKAAALTRSCVTQDCRRYGPK
ncbi:MAG TPA: hypothetical protein VJ866_21860 [Pyrinomonadaceae bacterium]|nr:hypothetical protein [Pyrinomonadaceae bacterium]